MATGAGIRGKSTGNLVVQTFANVALLMSLAACGGGGGDDGGALSLTLSSHAVTFQSQQYSSVRPPRQTITATAKNGELYLQLLGYNSAYLSCSNNKSCSIDIDAPSEVPTEDGRSSYSIGVRACTDPLCAGELPRQTITVTHIVSPGVQLTTVPARATLVADQAQTAEQVLNLVFANGTATSVSALASYPPNSPSGWLTLNATTSSVTAAAAVLAPGRYEATIVLTYSGVNFTNTARIPVAYSVAALPSVEHVAPYVALVNEPRTVVIRGKAFDRMTYPVTFGGLDAQSVTRISDTELRVTPPSFATPATYTVSIQNDRGVATGTAQYVVVAPQPYSAATIALPAVLGPSRKQVIHDAERQVVYIGAEGRVPSRAKFDSGAWVLELLPGGRNGRMSLSPDGDRMYYASGTTAAEYDLDEAAAIKQYENVSVENSDGIAILNDGTALLYADQTATLFEFQSGVRQRLEVPGLFPEDSLVSPDHSRVVVAGRVTNGESFGFDASTRTFSKFTPVVPGGELTAYDIAIDRHATRMVISNRVYDGNYALLGSLAGWVNASSVAISPDGTRAYVVFSWSSGSAELDVFDISGTSSFPQIGSSVTFAANCFEPGVTIAADGRTLFIACDGKFIVRPI